MDKVASGISELVARPEVPGTSQLSAADMSQYDEAAKRTSFSSTEALTPYKPDIFGLDKAGRDCALEMTQIEKEICSGAIYLCSTHSTLRLTQSFKIGKFYPIRCASSSTCILQYSACLFPYVRFFVGET